MKWTDAVQTPVVFLGSRGKSILRGSAHPPQKLAWVVKVWLVIAVTTGKLTQDKGLLSLGRWGLACPFL